MTKGTIIFVEEAKGFGFIASPEIPFTRIYFHWSGLKQDTLNFTQLKKGMEVEFIPITQILNGVKAIKIKVLEDDKRESSETTGVISDNQ